MNAQLKDFFSQCDERLIGMINGKTKKHLRRSA
jgi:hypothetical protein